MLLVADATAIYTVTGVGDVLEPGESANGNAVAAIGSGGNYALAAGKALLDQDLSAEELARKAMSIAAEICVYTNGNLTVEVL
jgi:ATP-dependent HslUV protease subunit HslV